jgi:hypothetical protein
MADSLLNKIIISGRVASLNCLMALRRSTSLHLVKPIRPRSTVSDYSHSLLDINAVFRTSRSSWRHASDVGAALAHNRSSWSDVFWSNRLKQTVSWVTILYMGGLLECGCCHSSNDWFTHKRRRQSCYSPVFQVWMCSWGKLNEIVEGEYIFYIETAQSCALLDFILR